MSSVQNGLILIFIREEHRVKGVVRLVVKCESAVSKFLKKFRRTECEERRQFCGRPRQITKRGARKLSSIILFLIVSRLLRDTTAEFNRVNGEKYSFRTISTAASFQGI